MADIHADTDALRALRDALARFRHAQAEVLERGDHEIEVTRAALERRASHWRSLLEQHLAGLDACRRAAMAAAEGEQVDCSAQARAVAEAQQRLEHISRWQQRLDQEAGGFRAAASRYRNLLDVGLPRAEGHLLAVIEGLDAARGIPTPRS